MVIKQRNIVFIFIILGFLYSCNKTKLKSVQDTDIENVTNYMIDSLFSQANHTFGYLISPIFDDILDDSIMNNFVNIKEFSEIDIEYLRVQYDRLLNKRIENYINKKNLEKLSNEEPINNEFYYILSPPIFTNDKEYVIFYSKSIFKVKGDYKWDQLIFLLKKDGDSYKRIASIKPSDLEINE